MVDGRGLPLALVLTPGQAGDNPQLLPVLDAIRVPRQGPGRPRSRPDEVLADKAYFHASTRAALRSRGIRFTSPEKSDQLARRASRGSTGGRPPRFDTEAYKGRNVVERCFNRLKQWALGLIWLTHLRAASPTSVMGMGGPGDHWYSDVSCAAGEAPVFDNVIDARLRDIRRFGGDALLQDGQPLAERLWALWPRWQHVDEESLHRLADDLAPVRDRLRAEAEQRGWDLTLGAEPVQRR